MDCHRECHSFRRYRDCPHQCGEGSLIVSQDSVHSLEDLPQITHLPSLYRDNYHAVLLPQNLTEFVRRYDLCMADQSQE